MSDLIATGIIPAVFCLAVGYWAVTAFGRWLDRSDADRQKNLAVGIADERRHTEDEPAEEILVVDPPVVPAYVACTEDWEDDDNCDTSGLAHHCAVAGPHDDHKCACGGEYLTDIDLTLPPMAKDPVAMRLGFVPPPPGMALFRGRLVHVRCLDPYLRHDARPCGECAGHLDQVLTGAS